MATANLNKLLRSEISAVETYQQALEKVREYRMESEEQQIASICQEHVDAANKLRDRIAQLGGKPPGGSGLWGSWSKLVMGSAKMMGEEATIRALKEGEENGIHVYQKFLEKSQDVPQDVRNLIQSTLLPRQQAHVQVLDQLMQQKPH